MKYQQITPAHDWFYVYTDSVTGKMHKMRVVMFALAADGRPVGLVSVSPPKSEHVNGTPDLLVEPPYPNQGHFIHQEEYDQLVNSTALTRKP